MNMVGSPKHVHKALEVGVDAVCAQGTEAGGHTGEVATLPLIPQCVDLCRGSVSPLHGGEVVVVGGASSRLTSAPSAPLQPLHRESPDSGNAPRLAAAGGVFDGRGMAAVLTLGAQAVWVGTRYACTIDQCPR